MSFENLQDLYQQVILDRARNPRHMHAMENPHASAFGDNPMCGDQIEIRLRLAPNNTIAEAAYEARGCAISLASADLMADAIQGKTPAEITGLAAELKQLASTGTAPGNNPLLEPLLPLSGVAEYPSRIKCATLPWTALLAALNQLPEAHHG